MDGLRCAQLVTFLLLCNPFAIVTGVNLTEVINIIPSLNDSCPAKTCLTLSQFALNSSEYIDHHPNITLILKPNNHSLDTKLSPGKIRIPSPPFVEEERTMGLLCGLLR